MAARKAKKGDDKPRKGAGRRKTIKGPGSRPASAAKRSRPRATKSPAKRLAKPVPHQLFPTLLGKVDRQGAGCFLAVAVRRQAKAEARIAWCEETKRAGKGAKGAKASKRIAWIAEHEKLARLLTGLGHPVRLKLLEELREDVRSHQDLKKAVGLQAGPLYHHLRELERSGLVRCPARNRYEATETGASALLVASGFEAIVSSKTRRGPWRAKKLAVKRTGRGRC